MKRAIFFILFILSAQICTAQGPPPVLDAANCETTAVTPSDASTVIGATFFVAFCAAAVVDGYSIWIDGEPITLTGELQKSDNMTSTGLREYVTPAINKTLAVGKHWISALVGTFNQATGKTEVASAPSTPLGLLAIAAPPPADCTGQVRLSVGEATPRIVVPGGNVQVTFSLMLSKVPVTNLEIRLNGTAVPNGLPTANDLRAIGSVRFVAPIAEGDYNVSVLAFGSNGCSDGVDRYIPISVRRQ